MSNLINISKLFKLTLSTYLKNTKMAGRVAIETVKKNSDQAKQIIEELKNEVRVHISETLQF